MTYKQAIKKLTPLLKGVTHIPKKEVEILLLYIIKQNTIWLYLNDDKECECFDELKALVQKRATHYPIEYIINQVTFYGEIFYINQGVLIPRPETELLVEKVINKYKNYKNLKILEIGVGSGVISTILSLNLDCQIIAVDINDNALNLSKKNFDKFNVSHKIKLIKSNLFENIDEQFDICVTNPPYISTNYKLPPNVSFEPKNALFGGDRGDEIIKQIINECYNRNIQCLACEIGQDQKEKLKLYLNNYNTKSIEFYKDYARFDRGFLVEFELNSKKI